MSMYHTPCTGCCADYKGQLAVPPLASTLSSCAENTRKGRMTVSVAVVQVSLKKYAKVSPGAFGLQGRKTIAIVRSSGKILLPILHWLCVT